MTDTMRKENEKILKAFEGLRVADIREVWIGAVICIMALFLPKSCRFFLP